TPRPRARASRLDRPTLWKRRVDSEAAAKCRSRKSSSAWRIGLNRKTREKRQLAIIANQNMMATKGDDRADTQHQSDRTFGHLCRASSCLGALQQRQRNRPRVFASSRGTGARAEGEAKGASA